ncbi:MAG: hypothetical protein K0S26_510 [Bacteroidota bacterium]|jgi:hypothetical protein|nr:hypothetical protein [Bacteroidota bacterium]
MQTLTRWQQQPITAPTKNAGIGLRHLQKR